MCAWEWGHGARAVRRNGTRVGRGLVGHEVRTGMRSQAAPIFPLHMHRESRERWSKRREVLACKMVRLQRRERSAGAATPRKRGRPRASRCLVASFRGLHSSYCLIIIGCHPAAAAGLSKAVGSTRWVVCHAVAAGHGCPLGPRPPPPSCCSGCRATGAGGAAPQLQMAAAWACCCAACACCACACCSCPSVVLRLATCCACCACRSAKPAACAAAAACCASRP